jgi:hypothetical protein
MKRGFGKTGAKVGLFKIQRFRKRVGLVAYDESKGQLAKGFK